MLLLFLDNFSQSSNCLTYWKVWIAGFFVDEESNILNDWEACSRCLCQCPLLGSEEVHFWTLGHSWTADFADKAQIPTTLYHLANQIRYFFYSSAVLKVFFPKLATVSPHYSRSEYIPCIGLSHQVFFFYFNPVT